MNWRCFFQLGLLSLLAAGLSPKIAEATKAPAAKPAVSPTAKPTAGAAAKPPVVAQTSPIAQETTGTPLPWLIGGGAAALGVAGGAWWLYRLGRQSGHQEARIGQQTAIQYRTLGDLAPAIPSSLEEELSNLRSARSHSHEFASEEAEFAAQLHEFDAAQLDAAFADVDTATHLPAAQQVFPMTQSHGSIAVTAMSDHSDSSEAFLIHHGAINVVSREALTVSSTVVAPTVVEPTVVEPTVVEPAAVAPTVAPIVLTSTPPPVEVVSTSAIVPHEREAHQVVARPVEGELITTTPAIGLRQTRLPKVGAVENLLKEIQNPDPVKRRKAIWDLGQWGDTRAVQPLVDLMLEADSKQRSLILSALSEIGTRTIKPMSKALAISLQDDNPDVRKNAIRDLTRIYDLVTQVSQMVQHCAIDDPDAEVRETANWALKQLNRIRPMPLDGNLAALSSVVSRPESLP
jgi:HEAT repeats